MRHGTEVLHGMALLLQRIIRSGSSLYLHLVRLDLKRLLRFRGSDESTCYNNGGAYVQLADLGEVLHGVMIYDLKRIEAGARSEERRVGKGCRWGGRGGTTDRIDGWSV